MDSLRSILARSSNDTVVIDTKLQLSNAYISSSPLKAYDEAYDAYILADSLGYDARSATSANQIALTYYYRGNLDESLRYLRISLAICEAMGDSMRIANSINNIGVISYDQGQLDEALKSYLRSLDLKERLKDDKASIAMTLNNIGNVYKDLRKFEKSLEYYQRSLDLKQEEADLYGEAMTLNNIGLLHHDEGEYEKALDFYNQSLLIKKGIDDIHGEAMTINNIGLSLEAMGRYDEAIESYVEANQLRLQIGDDFGRVMGLISLAGVYKQREDWDRAIFYGENALRLGKEINVRPLIRDAAQLLSELHEGKGENDKALAYYKEYTAWKDSVLDQESKEDLTVLESKEEVRQATEQVEDLQEVTDYQALSLKNQNIIFWLLLGIGALILAFSALLFFRYRRSRRLSDELKQLSVVASETNNYVIITDKNDHIIWVNEGFTKITGYTYEEVKGVSPGSFLRGAKTDAESSRMLDQAYDQTGSLSGEILNYRKDGVPIWLSYNATPVLDSHGEIEKFVCIGNEITEQKEAQQRMRQYSSSLEVLHSIDSILISDRSESEVLADTIRLIVDQIPYCDRIAFISIRLGEEDVEYYVSDSMDGGTISSELVPLSEFKTVDKVKKGDFYLEQNLEKATTLSNSDKELMSIGIKSYIAYPLMFQDELIAVLFLGSRTAEVFKLADLDMIREVSKTLSIALTQKKYQDEIKEKNKNITDSINYAWRIQKASLPELGLLENQFDESFLFYRPRDIVSGDFYWFGMKNDVFILACADCTGHGVPGGFMTMMGMNLLNNIVNEKGVVDPGLILTYLHVGVMNSFSSREEEMSDGMDISICAFSNKNKTLQYAGARQPLMLLRDQEITLYPGTKLSIGEIDHELSPEFETLDLELQANDQLYMYSDGYVDQFGGPKGKKYGRKRLEEFLISINEQDMSTQKERIESQILNWMGNIEAVDDMIMIGVKI